MFCAIRPLDFRSHLKLDKNVLFWAGDEIIFLSPFKTAVEKKAVLSKIYHHTYLYKGSNFLYYTAN